MRLASAIAAFLFIASVSSAKEDAAVNSTNPRYGLIAPSLGVPPVPGASYGGGNQSPGIIEGSYSGPPPPPSVHPKPITSCSCTPVSYCQSAPIKKPEPGYGGGSHPPPPPPPVQPGPGYEIPPPQPGYPAPGPEPSYPAPGPEPGHGGPGPVQPGYGPDGSGFDGAGLIDIRIVNRPPSNVACGPDEVYCCPGSNHGGNQGPGHIGGCGTREYIDTPAYKLEYGQAKFGAFPWMAVMLGPNNNYLGAGVLIDNIHVLTAAHKVADHVNPTFKIRLGEWNAAQDDEPYKHVEIPAARVEIHPAFNRQNLQNDVAIVTLAQPVSLDAFPHIKAACLPGYEQAYTGTRCWVAGFGKDAFTGGKHSYILREVDVPIVESNDCEQRLRGTRLGSYFSLNRKSFLCAGGEDGKDACTGDGGSPLLCELNGRWTVTGLVAWGIGCAEYGIPGVYVNIPNYVNWIESYISRDGPGDLAGYARVKPKEETKP